MNGAASIYPDDAVLLAPLSDYSDYPFRRACRRHGCRFAFTPLIDAGCLVYGRDAARQLAFRGTDEPWLGVQLLGADPRLLAEGARLLNDGPFEVLDFNMGCPMPKVTRRGAGAALGADLDRSRACLEAILTHSRFPVTAKIRVLSPADPEPTVRYAQALAATGIRALTVHGRVLQAIYAGPVAMHVIRAVRDALAIPVIANGGVFGRDSAAALRRGTGCGRIMIARGAIGNPWVFRELLAPGPVPPPTHAELCAELELQVLGMVEREGERNGLKCARKILHAYLKGRGYRHLFRDRASHIATVAEFTQFLQELRAETPAHVPPAARGLSPDAAALHDAEPQAAPEVPPP